MGTAKPPEPAKEISLFLTAGGTVKEGVQVLDIDVARGLVKISNAGTFQTLEISRDMPRSAAAAPLVVWPVQ